MDSGQRDVIIDAVKYDVDRTMAGISARSDEGRFTTMFRGRFIVGVFFLTNPRDAIAPSPA